jgi:hypothetical protein
MTMTIRSEFWEAPMVERVYLIRKMQKGGYMDEFRAWANDCCLIRPIPWPETHYIDLGPRRSGPHWIVRKGK